MAAAKWRASRSLLLLLLLFTVVVFVQYEAEASAILKVRRKFNTNRHSVAELLAHDDRRHARLLAGVDVPIGGLGLPTDAGLYFAEIEIGTPAQKFFVQVDTGSDVLWVNCISCQQCPLKTDLDGVELNFYDPKASLTAKFVSCDDSFCKIRYEELNNCSTNWPCQYQVMYGDGSSTGGFYMTDYVTYNEVYADDQITRVNASVSFGCGAEQSGKFNSSSGALDGILGFGRSNVSMLSQLASSGKVKKIFSHCLDSVKGGGIFAIGKVVEPQVETTPLVPKMQHYNVNMKAIEVGGTFLPLPSVLFEDGDKSGTILDSGTTLAYIAEDAYRPLMDAIFSNKPGIQFHTDHEVQCFTYNGSVDDGFPEVVFHFQGSLQLHVPPHDYLFQNGENVYCIGWLNGGLQFQDTRNVFLLGDLVLSNKLVLYDLENHVIGWTAYDCSSSIKIQDDITGEVYTVNAHNLSSGYKLQWRSIMSLLLIILCCSVL